MRFAPIFLLAAASFCSAQTVTVPNNTCMAARIIAPPDAFTMPLAKTPEMQTMKGSVISTAPACAKAQPKPIVVKRVQFPFAPPVKPELKLLPNPFTPFTR